CASAHHDERNGVLKHTLHVHEYMHALAKRPCHEVSHARNVTAIARISSIDTAPVRSRGALPR
ncbi:MAG: hypothetical protein ACREIT_05905, partial [Tepidisphaeraceae bacterium]